jgi:hypothetical protein
MGHSSKRTIWHARVQGSRRTSFSGGFAAKPVEARAYAGDAEVRVLPEITGRQAT